MSTFITRTVLTARLRYITSEVANTQVSGIAQARPAELRGTPPRATAANRLGLPTANIDVPRPDAQI